MVKVSINGTLSEPQNPLPTHLVPICLDKYLWFENKTVIFLKNVNWLYCPVVSAGVLTLKKVDVSIVD